MNLILLILAIICLECNGNHLSVNDDLFDKPNLRHQHHSEIVRHRLQEAVQAFKFKPYHRTTTNLPILENSHRLRHSNRLHQTWDRKYHSFENKSILTTTHPPRTVYRKSLSSRQHSGHSNHKNSSTPHRQRHYKAPVTPTTVLPHSKKMQNAYDILKIPYRDRLNGGKRFDKEIDDDQDDDNDEDKDYRNDYFEQDDRLSIQKKTPSNMLKTYENHKNKNSRKRPSVELDDYYDDEEQEDIEEEDENEDEENQRKNSKTNDDNYDIEDISSKSYVSGSLTQHKMDTLGTHEAVRQARQRHLSNKQKEQKLAAAHAHRVFLEGTCKIPKPKVIPIRDDPSKTYYPHCTILHRCGDDTGCCITDDQTCVVKKSQIVDLYFYVSTLGSRVGKIEKQTFVNHTECHCASQHAIRHSPPPEPLRKKPTINCICPKIFETVLQDDGSCRCDCSSGNAGCDSLKRGKEHFSLGDRKCISEDRCKIPKCEYGYYLKRHGRCPKKEDKLEAGFSSKF